MTDRTEYILSNINDIISDKINIETQEKSKFLNGIKNSSNEKIISFRDIKQLIEKFETDLKYSKENENWEKWLTKHFKEEHRKLFECELVNLTKTENQIYGGLYLLYSAEFYMTIHNENCKDENGEYENCENDEHFFIINITQGIPTFKHGEELLEVVINDKEFDIGNINLEIVWHRVLDKITEKGIKGIKKMIETNND